MSERVPDRRLRAADLCGYVRTVRWLITELWAGMIDIARVASRMFPVFANWAEHTLDGRPVALVRIGLVV